MKGRIVMEQKQNELLEEIISLEWEWFTHVQNQGGRAPCQDDKRTFDIMRKSQFQIWSQEALYSYLEDIRQALKEGRNLMTEKYAYMMETTDPSQFQRIRLLLPEVSEEKKQLVLELTQMQIRWMEEFQEKYPDYAGQGRPLREGTKGGGPGAVSLETYSKGELTTYSAKTLRILKEHLEGLEKKGKNPGICIMDYTARQYGYQSAQDAQDYLKRQKELHSF